MRFENSERVAAYPWISATKMPSGDFKVVIAPVSMIPCDYDVQFIVYDKNSCKQKFVMKTDVVKVTVAPKEWTRTTPITWAGPITSGNTAAFSIDPVVAQPIGKCNAAMEIRESASTDLSMVTIVLPNRVSIAPRGSDLACDYTTNIETYDVNDPARATVHTDRISWTVKPSSWSRYVNPPTAYTVLFDTTEIVVVNHVVPSPAFCNTKDM